MTAASTKTTNIVPPTAPPIIAPVCLSDPELDRVLGGTSGVRRVKVLCTPAWLVDEGEGCVFDDVEDAVAVE